MRPVVRLQSRIWQVRDAQPGETVGYGATFEVGRPTRIATVALGYGDGYPRTLSNQGQVFVAGQAAPIIGRISMDSTTIDVSGLAEDQVRPGTLVDVIGPGNPVDAVASAAGTHGRLSRPGEAVHGAMGLLGRPQAREIGAVGRGEKLP
jgi:alanine racemase